MELSKKQQQIVDAPESKVVVIAAAASGKTAVLTERVRHLLDNGEDPKKIVVITFTNAAAEEIVDRLGKPQGLFVGTIHSYANYLLLASGHSTSKYLDNEQFDKLFEAVKRHPECTKEVNHLLLDEAQDSNELQFEFIFDYVKPHNYMLVGDFRQSIYRWNGAYPDYILDLSKQSDVKTYDLNENYRNGSDILRYAKSIIQQAGYDYIDNSIPMRGVSGRVVEVDFSPDYLVQSIKKYGDYKDWFILTRKNQELDDMCIVLKRNGIPFDTFKKAQLNNKEINEKLNENTVKVLTIHTAKGLEAPNVIVVGQKFYNLEEKCISYVAATRARDMLVWTTTKHKAKKKSDVVNWE